MKRFAVSLLICAFSVIMIAQLSSALIIQSHSKQIQINEEDTLEIGIKTLIWLTVVKRKKSHPCQLFFSGPFPGYVPRHPQRRSQCCDG